MAITLEANYSKKLGLPNYSSHQFSVSVKTELNNIDQIEAECTKLYRTLQGAVDLEIQNSGFLPGQTPVPASNDNGNGSGSGSNANSEWNCSDKQRGLLLNLVAEQALDKEDISILAKKRFGKEVKALNKLEMGGLLDELLNSNSQKSGSSRQTGAPSGRGR